MLTLFILMSLPLLVLCGDLQSCFEFYRDANRDDPAASASRRLAPNQVTLRHALLFLRQKANYHWQLVTAVPLLVRTYLRPKPTTDRNIALLMINTSLLTWLTTKPLGGGALAVTLDMDGFAFPLFPDRYDNRLVVETELRLPGGAGTDESKLEAHTVRFELNGVAIESIDEQLSILAMMISSVSHPVIHSFNNRVYESHKESRMKMFEDFFLHGQYLNWCAWTWPGRFFRIARDGHLWYRKVLSHNAELPVPHHNHASLGALMPFSRSVRFLTPARGILARLLKSYDLPVDREALYICTVMHAVDHVSCDLHTNGHLLRNEKLSNKGLFNFIALLFYRPSQYFWTNLLKDKRGRNPFYEELYKHLHEIDPGLADQVTLSISY